MFAFRPQLLVEIQCLLMVVFPSPGRKLAPAGSRLVFSNGILASSWASAKRALSTGERGNWWPRPEGSLGANGLSRSELFEIGEFVSSLLYFPGVFRGFPWPELPALRAEERAPSTVERGSSGRRFFEWHLDRIVSAMSAVLACTSLLQWRQSWHFFQHIFAEFSDVRLFAYDVFCRSLSRYLT